MISAMRRELLHKTDAITVTGLFIDIGTVSFGITSLLLAVKVPGFILTFSEAGCSTHLVSNITTTE